jgi:GNAT superfamily N-acetyltransferase
MVKKQGAVMNNITSIPVRTWYLQMKEPPAYPRPEFSFETNIVQAVKPTVAFYQFLYNQVGKGLSWYNRLLMFEDELLRIIHHPGVEIYVLWVGGVPAGFLELDFRQASEIELVYFGILPEFRGRGLGPRFLQWAVHKAWSVNPERFWLHTCELDDKAAMPMYLKAGFKQYAEKMETQHIIPQSPDES